MSSVCCRRYASSSGEAQHWATHLVQGLEALGEPGAEVVPTQRVHLAGTRVRPCLLQQRLHAPSPPTQLVSWELVCSRLVCVWPLSTVRDKPAQHLPAVRLLQGCLWFDAIERCNRAEQSVLSYLT